MGVKQNKFKIGKKNAGERRAIRLGVVVFVLLFGGLIFALQPHSPVIKAVAVWLTDRGGEVISSDVPAASDAGEVLPADIAASPEPEEVALARKVVALTFDDGPHEEITPQILDILKEEEVTATFFLMGEKVEECPKLVERMVGEGHQVGNHTYSHVDLSSLSTQQAKEEIEHAQEIIEEITGEAPVLLRPPFGKVRENEVPEELLVVSWNVDTLDWTGSSAGQILKRVQKQIKPGAIILMHDQYRGTVEALPELIRWVKEQGYEFVTVEELLLL